MGKRTKLPCSPNLQFLSPLLVELGWLVSLVEISAYIPDSLLHWPSQKHLHFAIFRLDKCHSSATWNHAMLKSFAISKKKKQWASESKLPGFRWNLSPWIYRAPSPGRTMVAVLRVEAFDGFWLRFCFPSKSHRLLSIDQWNQRLSQSIEASTTTNIEGFLMIFKWSLSF